MRRLVSVLLVMALSCGLAPPAHAEDDALSILEKAVKAHGGESVVAKMKFMRIKMRGVTFVDKLGERPFTLEAFWRLPDRYRSTVETIVDNKPHVRTIVVNGQDAAISENGQLSALPENKLAEVKRQMYTETLCKLLPLRDKEYKLSMFNADKVENKAAFGIKVKAKDRQDVNLFFDKDTYLLVKVEQKVQDATGNEITNEFVFRDYRTFAGGVKHWTKVAAFADRKKVAELELLEVKLLDKLDDSFFKKP